jgi:hypothetical protein
MCRRGSSLYIRLTMLTPSTSPKLRRLGPALAVSLGIVILSLGPGLPLASAQWLGWLTGGPSPLFSYPRLEGELRVAPTYMAIVSGKNTLPSRGLSWDLKNQFDMGRERWFVDIWGKLQVGAFAVRLECEPRDFVGVTRFRKIPTERIGEARLDFTGLKVGVDFDFFNRYGVKMGVNADYYCYLPHFSESIQTNWGGKRIDGEAPVTFGGHLLVTAPAQFSGLAPVFEARASWPFSAFTSAELTDLKISGGLRGPTTVLGTVGLMAGYRRTGLAFSDLQIFDSGATLIKSHFDVVMAGWFVELAYFY